MLTAPKPSFKIIDTFYAITTANPYWLKRRKVLLEAEKVERETGVSRHSDVKRISADQVYNAFPEQLVLFLLSISEAYAVAILDEMLYHNKELLSKITIELARLSTANVAARNMLATYLVVCCQDPDIAFTYPPDIRDQLAQSLLERYNINLMKPTKIPYFLLRALMLLLLIVPFAFIFIFFTNMKFFFGSHLGWALFFLMFFGSYWMQRLTKLVSRLAMRSIISQNF